MRGGGSFASVEASPAAVAAHYDELDAFYREVWGAHVHHGLWIRGDETYEQAKENLVSTIAEKAKIKAGSSVCDIGCGYGETARWIAQHLKSHVTGITVSRAQYDYARAHALNDTHQDYILGDWLTNNLPDHSFDAAVAIESSEHMPDLRALFSQARRVLQCGGLLVISAWLAAENATNWQRRWLLDPISRTTHMTQIRTISEYRGAAVATGFSIGECEDFSNKVVRTWPSVSRTFLRALAGNPRYVKFLVGRHAANRRFGLTIARIWIAYRLKALRYFLLVLTAI